MTDDFPKSTVLGYPRIGPQRELKRALEGYWAGRIDRDALAATGRQLRAETWRRLAELGLEGLPSNTFSLYDHVLDAAVAVDAVPDRFRDAADPYFAMARGTDDVPALRMTKWFDTNYHYIVPEIGPKTRFRPVPDKMLDEVHEARTLGHETRPVLVGPVTFLHGHLGRLDDLLDVYGELLRSLADAGVEWVQLDEPVAVVDGGAPAIRHAYRRLAALQRRPKLLVASYFGRAEDALPALAVAPVDGVAIDLTHGVPENLQLFAGRTIVGGVVSGRNVWRTDFDAARALLAAAGATSVSTSCSLLHVPYTLRGESGLPDGLAFAEEKVAEVVALAALGSKPGPLPTRPLPTRALDMDTRRPYAERVAAQADLGLPPLPVTTIGSFPQTGELRKARTSLSQASAGQSQTPPGHGSFGQAEYEARIEAEIARVIGEQEALGLDVLVHGEPERNDMVQYFAEHLDGFAVSRNGWVQSYGSRCTRPPILHGDVRRRGPITVRWAKFAQSLTARPVKGMLTGPVTIVAWSFVRPDRALPDVTLQVAEAVREEVRDLEAAGIRIIQVDEPALRELLPLDRRRQEEYLQWAVAAYRRATGGAADGTQIHTHLCYSEASAVLEAIDALDADVTSIEAARSGFAITAFARGIGPGVYDIHSPRIPDRDEIAGRLRAALRVIPAERLWVNPDCGLKTRTYDEVRAALANVVAAAHAARESLT
ncbi:5-methyltetrahydropteroyltriglutamate--homocysteine S-methyltransferase [Dactylosporangium matsuzakiense]|uniref:5-methyltetrahydropteroyltriglutamate--homocysteine S-methyltransferase n=1 Tax=Dactylosporangium matsuzakiense TaxID=53360 RepID=A0A9W6KW22_9ACTN|nr:5-methyltetrahydropteroyltriglutamate--homocysteine S-methyltransferase [Dactylosporangium matsuzakiense]UWZ46717.1 5-methyltetrahydropteroyltriglutamate--homocysteine S-methyltransferase [Dactylosporangium matsuzakiense]GLL08257.1 5-methyltetrahydropteroyltriglutamate--homocysteine methyltransferase [Dactylosporangium matsuzakiense]